MGVSSQVRKLLTGSAVLLSGVALGVLVTKSRQQPTPEEELVEVGAIGGDLRYWRAKEALRHAEVRLGVQAQANQALEARATAMLGWSVTGGLALGAAVVNGVHFLAASAAATCLLSAAILCIIGITTREWIGPGYRPEDVMHDPATTELLVVESLITGYRRAVQSNHEAFRRFSRLLKWALGLIVAAPLLGGAVLLITWYRVLPILV